MVAIEMLRLDVDSGWLTCNIVYRDMRAAVGRPMAGNDGKWRPHMSHARWQRIAAHYDRLLTDEYWDKCHIARILDIIRVYKQRRAEGIPLKTLTD